MVFYYSDLDIDHKISDWLIVLLTYMMVLLPIIIYMKRYNLALIISSVISIFQIYSLIKNIYKHPL
jgi:hypothetical protein